jgi:hypothetical protein
MYDIRQSVQFLKEVSQQCLEKDIKQTQRAHPHMNEAEILQHVTKYSLLFSIEGTPRWHKSELKDLLAMVDKFGMSDLFLTLTADEASSLRWEEIADIEQIVQQINKSMTWKDCPVECATLIPLTRSKIPS